MTNTNNPWANINVNERLNALIKRRKIELNDNVKYRGKLRTSKWFTYEASQKQHLLDGWK